MNRLLFAEDVSHTANLRANSTEFLFEVLVAAVKMIDAIEDGLAVGDKSC